MGRNSFNHGNEQELLVRQKLISLGCRAMSSPHRDHARKVDVEITHSGIHRLNWPVDIQLSLKKNDREKIKDFFDSRTDINYRLSMYVRFGDELDPEAIAVIIKKHILDLNSLSNLLEKRYVLTIRNGEESLMSYPQFLKKALLPLGAIGKIELPPRFPKPSESQEPRIGKITAFGSEGVTIRDENGHKYHARYTDFLTMDMRDIFNVLKQHHTRGGDISYFRSKTLKVRFTPVEKAGQPACATLVSRG